MAKAVSKEVMQELVAKLESVVNNYCYKLEYFTDEEVDNFFQANEEEVTYYNGLINDNIESKNFLWSSKKVAEELAKKVIEANEYTDSLVKNIASIKLKYVTSLPTSDISENTIYILKASDGSSKDTLNLYNATDGWTSIGDFNISLDDYYTKTEIDTKMDLKANKTEVVSNDKIVQTLDSTTNSSDTVLSTSGLQTEMDKKANDDEVIKKTSLVTSIDSSSTDSEVPSAKAVLNLKSAKRMNESINPENYEVGDWYAEGYDGVLLSTSDGHPCSEWHIGYIVTGFKTSDGKGYKKILAITMNGNCYVKVQKWDKWSGWRKLCATSVADVPYTNITYNTGQSNYVALSANGTNFYSITNGICQCSIYYQINVATAQGSWVSIITGLPKPKNSFFDVIPSYNNTGAVCQGYFLQDGTFRVSGGTNSSVYMYTFSYPVAES